MTTPAASDAVVSAAPSTFDKVGEAAIEIARLYAAFDTSAVELTADYIQQQLDGEEGVTWDMFPRGFLGRPTPFLDSIVRRDGVILLGAGYNMWFELLDEFRLTKVEMSLPGADGSSSTVEAITVRRSGRGFDPGSRYAIVGSGILVAGFDHHGSVPTVGAEGKLAWSTPRSWVNDTYSALTEVGSDLHKVVERLRAYEPTVG